jgi:ubiquitin C-terminal hydrolase
MQYNYLDENLVPPPNGFNNMGNTCWFNSLLQSLLSCSSINYKMLTLGDTTKEFHVAYISMLKKLLPGDVVHNLCNGNPSMNVPLMNLPLEELSGVILGALIRFMMNSGSNTMLGNSQECADEGFTYMFDAFDNISNGFGVQYELEILPCANCNFTPTPIRDNAYNIKLFDSSITFNDEPSLSKFIHKHTSDVDEYKCERCKTIFKTKRIETLKRLKDCIVLQFNKYFKKDLIWFPQQIYFDTFPRGNQIKYELCAQIEHVGTRFGGHYYAYVLRNGNWYCVNDSSVSNATPGPTPNTYLAFYHIVKN